MFPRRSAISRWLAGAAFFTLCCWMWLATPTSGPTSDVILPAEPMRSLLVRPTHMEGQIVAQNQTHVDGQSAKNQTLRVTQSHHHTNQTLESMRKNMTIFKANMSGLGAIVDGILASNNSALQVVLDRPDNKQGPARDAPASFEVDPNVPNPHPFKYILNGKYVCKNKDVFLVIYIHTAPSHYKRRMIIRQTWGNPKYYPDTVVRLVFVMGWTQEKPEVQQALAFESEQYGDLVQEDFEDTYRNLTYKGIAALKWISHHCSHSKFVLKTDDDIFVNMFTLLRHLQSLERFGTSNTNLLMCLVWHRMKVMREGKWKVDEAEFKDSHYPTYCSGSAYTMSTDVALAMHRISYQVPFFWVDDFYITGLLPLKLGTIKHKQLMSTYVLDGRKLEEKFTGPQWFTYIFSHVHDLNKIQSVWDTLVKLASGAAVAKVEYALPGQLPKDKSKPKG